MVGSDLLDRTLVAVAENVRWVLLAEETPEREGFLQAVTPAVKLLGVFALVCLTVTRRDVASVATLLVLAAALAAVSRVPTRAFLGRVAGPPAVAAIVVAPQAFLMDGPTLATLPLSVAGLEYVLLFTLRVAACVGFLSVLLLTTRFDALLAAFRHLHVPAIAVSLLAITYRYLLVFFAELERMVRARRGRTVTDPDLGRTWRDSGNFLGTFLLRSLERGEGVQRAARARGGPGPPPLRTRAPLGSADAAFCSVVAITVVGVLL
ncbi:MAG: cobalt ECF transporter T component CbiQ [Natronomonas sp.]